MSRNRSSKNDWRRFKKFEEDNEKLKKEVNKLRRMVNGALSDSLEKKAQRILDGLPPIIPVCQECKSEKLDTITINRTDGEFEIKVCKQCNHRHQMKKKNL